MFAPILIGGTEEIVGNAAAVFTEAILVKLRMLLRREALDVPVLFTERLSNSVLAVCLGFRDNSQLIAVNARCKADPELIAHTMIEEFVHAQQRLDKVNFEEQRRLFAYHERPYEQEAKRIATATLGYEPTAYDVDLQREEPTGILFNKSNH